jgi:hypothetical protein
MPKTLAQHWRSMTPTAQDSSGGGRFASPTPQPQPKPQPRTPPISIGDLLRAYPTAPEPIEGHPDAIVPLESFQWTTGTGAWRFTKGVPALFGDKQAVEQMRAQGLVR